MVTLLGGKIVPFCQSSQRCFSQMKAAHGEKEPEKLLASKIRSSQKDFLVIEDRLVSSYRDGHFDVEGEIVSLFIIEMLQKKGPARTIDSICRLLKSPVKINFTQIALSAVVKKAVEEKSLAVERFLDAMWDSKLSFIPDYDAIVTNILLPYLRWSSIDKIATRHVFAFDTYVDIFDTLLTSNPEHKSVSRPYNNIAKLLQTDGGAWE